MKFLMTKGCFSLLTIALIFCQNSFSQNDEASADTTTISFKDKLVALAIANNPDIEILENNQDIAKYNMQKSRWNWINQIQVQGNLNEFTLNPPDPAAGQANFFPRYNISMTVPLGVFGTRANEVRIAKRQFETTDFEMMKKQQEIRKQVLTLYENYLLYDELIRLQTQRTDDENIFYQTVEDQFANQQATMTEFKEASNKYNVELEKKYSLVFEQKAIAFSLEYLIGMSLDEAKKQLTIPVEE